MEILIIIANLAFTVFTCFAVMGVHPAKVNGCILAFLCLELIGSFNLKKLFTIPTKYELISGKQKGVMYSQHLPSRTTFTDGEYKI